MASSSSLRPYSTPMPVGPHILCAEKARKSTPARCTSTGKCGTDCAPSTRVTAPAWCARRMISCGRVDRAQHVGHVGEGDQLRARARAARGRLPDPAARRRVTGMNSRRRPLLGGQHVPGHQVGVVLHLGQDHHITGLQVGPAPGVRHQVDRLGGVAGEDHLPGGRCVDEFGHLLACAFVEQRCSPPPGCGCRDGYWHWIGGRKCPSPRSPPAASGWWRSNPGSPAAHRGALGAPGSGKSARIWDTFRDALCKIAMPGLY